MDILFPLGGMNRRAGFQYQPPFITTDCVNVLPDSTQLGRRRGGSRPGIGAWSYGKYDSSERQSDPLGSTPVRMLASVRYNDLTYYKVWEDKFEPPAILPVWSAPAWGTISLPSLDSQGRVYATASQNKGLVREVISHNTTTPHAIAYTMLICPQNGSFHGTYKIWFRMNSTTPVLTTDGFEVTLTLPRTTAGTFSCSANKYVTSTPTAYGPYTDATWASIFSTTWPIDYTDAATFTVVHDYATEIVRAYWLGYQVLNPQISPTADGIDITGMSAGIRFGFGISGTAAATGRALCESARVHYQITSETKQFTKVLCSTNARYSGSLTTRTSNTAGIVTLVDSTHGLAVNDVIDVEWSSGSRTDVTVTAVSSNDITFSGGSGDNLASPAPYSMTAIVNGAIFYVDPLASGMNWFTRVASWTLNSDHKTQTAERNGRLYMADWDAPVYSKSSASVGYTGAGPYNWTFEDGNPGNDLEVLYGADIADRYMLEIVSTNTSTSAVPAGLYRFTIVNSGAGTNNAFQLVRTTTYTAADVTYGASTASIAMVRAPKIFNPVANTIAMITESTARTELAKSMPANCQLICTYRDRLVLARSLANPWVWHMSRQGDPTDWNYGASADDAQRAVAATNNDAGQIPEPITALIPFGNDYLVFGAERSLWMLRGDPADGGRIDNLSRTVGIIDADAWCWLPDGSIMFLSYDGLYRLSGAAVQSVSREALPRELVGVDPNVYQVQMSYDDRQRGVFIFISAKQASSSSTDSSANYHWFFDIEGGGLWPLRLPTFAEPTALHSLQTVSPTSYNGILIGGRDSYIRWMPRWFETDNGETLTNKVLIGPLRVGPDGSWDSELNEIFAVLGNESYSVTWRIYADETAERAYQRYLDGTSNAQASGTWSEHLNTLEHPRVRGAVAYIELAGAGTKPWALETITARIIRGGKLRTVR